MAPYIPAARRRPRFSTADPDSVSSPAAMLAMIASSSLYALLAPIILRHHVAQVNARNRDDRPTRNTAAGDARLTPSFMFAQDDLHAFAARLGIAR
jgi:hypothetical protein